MNRTIVFLYCCFLVLDSIFGIPAYPRKIIVLVDGQERTIFLYGDEHNKRAETEDGYTIIQNDNQQWCYAQLNADSSLVASPWEISVKCSQREDLRSFLAETPKHLVGGFKKIKATTTSSSVASASAKAAIGNRRVLIILMGYKDLDFTKGRSDFEKLFNQEDYSDDGAQGSVRDYYLSASYNQLHLESDIYGPYVATHEMSFYGKNNGMENGKDANAYSLFEEAIKSAAQDADLGQYDGDGDGFIDNVHIIFAGHGEEAGAVSNAIWSHEATFYRPYEIQGLKIDRYSCAPELRGNSGTGITRIGPHCHEIGHALGAMDYYDTNYSTGGEYLGTGQWDIMASGSWNNEGVTPADFNPYVKAYNFGWISPKTLPAGEVKIAPSCSNADNYYILQSSKYGDYYLLENRCKEKWGAGVPGEGLLLFHVHSDIANAGNDINTTAPQMCYVVCASSNETKPDNTPLSYGDINSDGCPYPGKSRNRDFGMNSTPKAFYWDDDNCGIEINDIKITDNKDIILTNNSEGASFEPVQMERLFFEGFEDDANLSIMNLSKWVIEDNPENTMAFIDKPVAFEGVKSLHLSARDSKEDVTDSIEFICPSMANGRKRVRICVASLHLRFNKPNIVKVGYRISNNPDWIYAEVLSSENNRWRQSYIDLPNEVDSHFKIIGTVFAGSVIAIDNLEIEQEIDKNEMGIQDLWLNVSNGYSIHSLSGINQRYSIKGVNIIRDSSGKTYKVLSK